MNPNDLLLYLPLYVHAGTPFVTTDNTTKIVEYGQNVTLECNITSIPEQSNVYWIKKTDDIVTEITSETHNVIGVALIEPSLTILKATKFDSGEYACCATNLIGTGKSNFTFVMVVGGKIQ